MWWKGGIEEESTYEEVDDDYVMDNNKSFAEHEHNNKEHVETDRDWTTAHRNTCQSISSLQASPQQVLEYCGEGESIERPNKSKVVLAHSNSAVRDIAAYYSTQQQQRQQEKKTNGQNSSSRWISSIASSLYGIVFANDETAFEEWQQVDDNYGEREEAVGWKEEIVNLPLVSQCCLTLVEKAGQGGKVVWLKSDERECLEDTLCGWLQSLATDCDISLLSKLPEDQMQMLVRVLVEADHAKIFDDVVVVGMFISNDNESIRDAKNSIFRLSQAMKEMESRIEKWEHQRDISRKKALEHHTKKQKDLALTQLKRKAFYEHHLESAHATLLNLQQLCNAVESSQSNAELTNLLKESTLALQSSRLSGKITPEDIDNLALDLHEEYAHSSEINRRLQGDSTFDEELLLDDLQKLNISSINKSHGAEEIPPIYNTKKVSESKSSPESTSTGIKDNTGQTNLNEKTTEAIEES